MLKLAKIFILLLLSSSFAEAQTLAQWKYPNGVPSLPQLGAGDSGPDFALAVTNINTWQISILDMRKNTDAESACYGSFNNRQSEIKDVSPAKINGKYVKMISICLGDGGIVQPKTKEGKYYFSNLVLSGVPVDIYLSDTVHVLFPASDISAMKNKARSLNSAM
ncbi:hypothetical protein [Edwardsiella piscicida]|uniref:hypothetical protein n=1 Tax=Edwardsiella piscicida TaxID=1263550 RepID=UPI00370DB346